MQIHPVNRCLTAADQYCNYVPAISTLSNVVALFLKCVVHCKSKQAIANNHFYKHIIAKSIVDCILLLVPVIGNIIVVIINAVKKRTAEKNYQLGRTFEKGLGVPKDPAKGVHHYKLAANAGHHDAKYNLALCYKNGKGTPQNYPESYKLLNELAHEGDTDAIRILGDFHYLGQGMPVDFAKAIHQYTLAANKGNPEAQCRLGICYQLGKGVLKDSSKAATLFQESSKECLESLHFLAKCLWNGEGVTKDEAHAIELYQQAAEKGHEESKLNLAIFHSQGLGGLPTNKKKAIEIAEKLVQQGNLKVKAFLGSMYLNETDPQTQSMGLALINDAAAGGDAEGLYALGVCSLAADIKKAIHYWRQAHDKKHIGATTSLAAYLMYKGSPADQQEALGLFSQLADDPDVPTKVKTPVFYQLALACNEGKLVPKNPSEAFRFFSLCADQGFTPGVYQQGLCYEKGIGVARDHKKAFSLYEKAFQQNYDDATQKLAECYLAGRGTAQNIQEGFKLLDQMVQKGNLNALFIFAMCQQSGFHIPLDFAACYSRLNSIKGHEEAEFELAKCHLIGRGTHKNESLAHNMLEKLAKSGHLRSSELIVHCTLNGVHGYTKDVAKGTLLSFQLINQGYAPAMFIYAQYLLETNPSKYPEAKKWLQKSFDEGFGLAGLFLSDQYLKGVLFQKDLKKALEILEQSLEKDFPPNIFLWALTDLRTRIDDIRKSLITP